LRSDRGSGDGARTCGRRVWNRQNLNEPEVPPGNDTAFAIASSDDGGWRVPTDVCVVVHSLKSLRSDGREVVGVSDFANVIESLNSALVRDMPPALELAGRSWYPPAVPPRHGTASPALEDDGPHHPREAGQ